MNKKKLSESWRNWCNSMGGLIVNTSVCTLVGYTAFCFVVTKSLYRPYRGRIMQITCNKSNAEKTSGGQKTFYDFTYYIDTDGDKCADKVLHKLNQSEMTGLQSGDSVRVTTPIVFGGYGAAVPVEKIKKISEKDFDSAEQSKQKRIQELERELRELRK